MAKKSKNFGSLADDVFSDKKPLGSVKDFLSDEGDDAKPPQTEQTRSASVNQKGSTIPTASTPSSSKAKEPADQPSKEDSAKNDLVDKRTIFFSNSGSDALDDVEHFIRRAVGAGNKSKVSRSLIVDQAMMTIWQMIEEKKAEKYVESIINRILS